MLFAYEGLGLVLLAGWLFTLVDILMTEASVVRNLPKMAWFFVVLGTAEIGALLWWIAGRPQSAAGFPDHERPGAPTNPDDDVTYQAELRRRVQEQRRRAQEESDGAL